MSVWYLDTSAALKLVLAEKESDALIDRINAQRPELVASYLLETEIRRAAHRVVELEQKQASALLDRITLHEPTPAVFLQAGLFPGAYLRSLDALHLASAISIGVDCVVTYDLRMADAAADAGLVVIAPGRD
jgi:predicted nucleic acid-binding protein